MEIVVGMMVTRAMYAPPHTVTVTQVYPDVIEYIWEDGLRGERPVDTFRLWMEEGDVTYPVHYIINNFYGV